MAAPTGSLFSTHQYRIEERLGKTINIFLQQADPVWRDNILSSQSVTPIDEIGRDFLIHHTYQNAVGGVFENGSPRNDFMLYGDNQNVNYGAKLYTAGTSQTFPDAKEDPGALTYRLSIPMRTILTNMRWQASELRAEATPAFIGKIIAPRLLAFARGAQRMLCHYWYASQAENYRLSTLGPHTGTGAYAIDGTAKTLTFSPPNKAIARFAVGQRVDVFKDVSTVPTRLNDTQSTAANQTLTTRIKGFVGAVNKMTNSVVLQFDPNDSTFGTWCTTGNVGDSAYVVPANSTVAGNAFTGIAGLSSWLKFGGGGNDNKLLGAEAVGSANIGTIDVTTHPEFRSFLKAVNGVLTEHRLNLYLDRVTEALEDEGEYLDTLVTTQGAIRAAYVQKEGRQILDRTGRLSSLANEGEDGKGMVHHHNGREYMIWTSRWQQSGVLDGYRRTNNWVRAIPPRLPKAGTMSGVDSAIPLELVVPTLTGTNSTMFPILNSQGNLTEMSQMPGHIAMQVYPAKQVRGMRLTGLTEDRVYSD